MFKPTQLDLIKALQELVRLVETGAVMVNEMSIDTNYDRHSIRMRLEGTMQQ